MKARAAILSLFVATLVAPALTVFVLTRGDPWLEWHFALGVFVGCASLLVAVLLLRRRIGLTLSSLVVGAVGMSTFVATFEAKSALAAALGGAVLAPIVVLLSLPAVAACTTALERPAIDGPYASTFVSGVWFGALFVLGGLVCRSVLATIVASGDFAIAAIAYVLSSQRARALEQVRQGSDETLEILHDHDAGRAAPWLAPPRDGSTFEVVVRRDAGSYRHEAVRGIVRFEAFVLHSTSARFFDAYLRRAPLRSREVSLLVATAFVAVAVGGALAMTRR